MIKLVNALVGIFLVFAGGQWLSASAEAGEVLDRIMKKGAMVTATDPEWPPFSSRNDKGEFDGFDIAVAKELATRMGVPSNMRRRPGRRRPPVIGTENGTSRSAA